MDKLSSLYMLQMSIPEPSSLQTLHIVVPNNIWTKTFFYRPFWVIQNHFKDLSLRTLNLSLNLDRETHFTALGKFLSLLQALDQLSLYISFSSWLIESDAFSQFFNGMFRGSLINKLDLKFKMTKSVKPSHVIGKKSSPSTSNKFFSFHSK